MALNPRVLIVDDSPDIRDLVRVALIDKDYDVAAFPNGALALENMRENTPSLVILDLDMPVMNGFETLAKIRADPKLMTIPVVILSSNSERGDLTKGLSMGADEYLIKPMQPWEINARVSSLMSLSQLRRQVLRLEREKHAKDGALQRLSAKVCHHLLGIATHISGYLRLERRSNKSAFEQRLAGSMQRLSVQMVEILRTLGTQSLLAPSPQEIFTLNEIIDVAHNCIDWDSEIHDFETVIPADLPPIRGRRFELSMVFMDLFANAIASMPRGGLVRVTAVGAGAFVLVEVIDSGLGVPAHLQGNRPGGFDGLEAAMGFAIARRIIEEQGGSMELTGQPNFGCVATIRLPAGQTGGPSENAT
jgi:two-component system sensor histidine kinase/response regulator